MLGEFIARDLPLGRYRFVEPLESLERHLESRFGHDANARRDTRFSGANFVCLLDVLEHQPDDVGFLRELASKMDSGAHLLVTVPALMSLWSSWDVSLGHHRRYRRRGLRGRAVQSGFEVEELSYLFPELVPAGIVRRIRHPAMVDSTHAPEGAEFPDLPPWLNRALFALGTPSARLRRLNPFGSSLFAALRRR